jgi:hypothetical protein
MAYVIEQTVINSDISTKAPVYSPTWTAKSNEKAIYPFRLLDDDGLVYFYGRSTNSSSFLPLDEYGASFGCTSIEYVNYIHERWDSL